ncbi:MULTISPECIES: putative entry exclusion protein TrbK-alt [unclassified Rhizobium]|jgi:conjugative transfer region protein TrbK|uniref:putative entry exclusion protein TrbK-alt n=1 Tax=unclassified Rhizobium TaxID=2613769 RepID=UPI000646D17D|nr:MULTISPECIES: putative entry exclusion protein TrbK-alt [unclassified Rhizobium]MBN9579877.1 putative entry exclusion protein TrbK-alt [Alphaproteobacteria bacterium]OJY74103.1 MAG: conjugal transfer protein TrbK [Rhizobium sp. 60-20]RKD61469.1 conjugative transfer region protein TrbK [Rhizobium sp. WW_1]
MDGKMFARLGAVVFVAVAITATAIEMTRKEEPAESWASSRPNTTPPDPLRDELFRCQALGEAGPRDPACLRAWAENRRRFLAPDARPAERLPDPAPAPHPPAEAAVPAESAPVSPPTGTR